MTTSFNGIHYFSSIEVIERLQELTGMCQAHNEAAQGELFLMTYTEVERAEHGELAAFAAQCEHTVSDWKYGACFIHEDEFYNYIVEETKDCYPELFETANTYPHRFLTMDWDALVEANKQDYSTYTLDESTYYVRS